MNPYRLLFYREEDGTKPVGVFIRQLRTELKAKVVQDLHLLEEFGSFAREPLSKELEDGIFELRTKQGGDTIRILYFFDKGRIIICTNAFAKKTRKTPPKEIELAKQRRRIYHAGKEPHDEEK